MPGLSALFWGPAACLGRPKVIDKEAQLAIFGGRRISAEFAHIFSALGSVVTIVCRRSELLTRLDGQIGARFTAVARKRWDVRLETTVSGVQLGFRSARGPERWLRPHGLADPSTGHLMGAHVIGPQASMLIQPLIQAMAFDLHVHDMARGQYWIHPALSEVVENALLRLDVDHRPDSPY